MEIAVNTRRMANSSSKTDRKITNNKLYDSFDIIVEREKPIKEREDVVKSLENDTKFHQATTKSPQIEMKKLPAQTEIVSIYEERIHQLEEQLNAKRNEEVSNETWNLFKLFK